ncbi:hypothetical protein RUM44_011367 [Polyplax serrata]|uniref:Uncharacterized protein n=1 Tax=Polyplax serrata TaxID=468196 RepID=A0ABR1ARL1_POLSC
MGSKEHGKLMLGLSNEDSLCEYQQKTVPIEQPKRNASVKNITPGNLETVEPPINSLLLQEAIPVTAPVETNLKTTKENENETLSLFAETEPTEDNSKAFMGSFGSWINDLFCVPNKRPHSTSKLETKPFRTETPPAEEGADYFKSIAVLKEQFKKKLKSETSIHIMNTDKFQFNFNKTTDKRRRSRSLAPLKTTGEKDSRTAARESSSNSAPVFKARSDAADVLLTPKEKEDSVHLYRAKNSLNLNTSKTVAKDKKSKRNDRSYCGILDEYIVPAPAELSKRLLLNVEDQEKCSQLYKSTHVGLQESQHHVQRKNKSYQNSMRCYTTDAIMAKNDATKPVTKSMIGGRFADINNRKSHTEITSYMKARSAKAINNVPIESTKGDVKQSDELVKYLIKKVKGHQRPAKKKAATAPATVLTSVLNNGKTKFMQSATSSLVMNALLKKDSDVLLSPKSCNRDTPIKNDFATKPTFQYKGWTMKYDDPNVRIDMKRTNNQNFDKSSYLSNENIEPSDVLYSRNIRKTKRFYEGNFKCDQKDSNQKVKKQSTLHKSNIYRFAKVKQKDLRRNVQNVLDTFNSDGRESQSGRFQHQHEVFKSSLKTAQEQSVSEPKVEATENSNTEKSKINSETEVADISTSLPMELNVANKNLQLLPEESTEISKYSSPVNAEEFGLSSETKERDNSERTLMNCFNMDDNSLNFSVEKNKPTDAYIPYKDKLYKTKSLQFVKEDAAHSMLGSLDCATSDGGTESSSLLEPVPQEFRPSKTMDTVLLNRRYPINPTKEMSSKQKTKALMINYKTFSSGSIENVLSPAPSGGSSQESDKNTQKEKDKGKTPDCVKGNECSFEKIKKPGPNCEDNAHP